MTADPLELLFVVDPVGTLNAGHDTSVAMMESAQARGHRVAVTTMSELGVVDGRAVAACRSIRVRPATLSGGHWTAAPDWFDLGPPERRVLDDLDAVFVRTDPPVDAAYLRATYILDLVDPGHTAVVNAPGGLRHANEHLFALQFPELGPPTVVSADLAEIVAATNDWGTAVLKPTEGMAGRGILLLRPDDPNLTSILETATARGRDQVVVQRYLPECADGDRRVIVLAGTPIGVVTRVADDVPGEFRCNMACGARVVADAVTPRDKEICDVLAPRLAELGLVFVGLDVIGDRLTEINVTSPTGVREIDAFSGRRLSDQIVEWVERRTADRPTGADRR